MLNRKPEEKNNTQSKEMYQSPKMEIVKFDCEDVITTSGLSYSDFGDGDILDWDNEA